MSISEYNNQTILTINNARPINDDQAKERGNSLRLLGKSSDVNEWFECRDSCLNNPDCVIYRFQKNLPLCEIFRKEPYKEVKDLSLEKCTEFCSKDNDCDFLSHSVDNKCQLFTREKDKSEGNQSVSSIGKLWVDYPVYGLNIKKGVSADSFEDCRKKLGTEYFVYYDDAKYCIPKRFFKQSVGNTTIYFDKKPVDKFKAIDKLKDIDIIKSESRYIIELIKKYVVIIFLVLLILILYFLVKEEEEE